MNSLGATMAFVAYAVVLSASASLPRDVLIDGFAARAFVGTNGTRLPYRIFVPEVRERVRSLPVIIYLHGGGGVGADNLRQIAGGNTIGARVWATSESQSRHPAFVVAPQIPAGSRWDADGGDGMSPYASLVIELLGSLSREFAIDADRVYLTGQSLGGFGTWDLIVKRPEVFAAAVPLCGGGAPSRARAARTVPIWVFHGAKDQVVPVSRSREMVAALRAVGNAVKYTEYPGVGHDVWSVAYNEPGLPDWLFAQKRPSALSSLVVDGPGLHPSLVTRELEDAAQLALAPVLRGNPYLSTDSAFVDVLARVASQDRMNGEGIRAALYALYHGESHVGLYGLEATSDADANRVENVLRGIWSRNESLNRTRVHREGKVFVVVWHDGVSPSCWEAVNAQVVERLTAP